MTNHWYQMITASYLSASGVSSALVCLIRNSNGRSHCLSTLDKRSLLAEHRAMMAQRVVKITFRARCLRK